MPLPLKPNWAGQFDSFKDYFNVSQRVKIINKEGIIAILIDSKGRRCYTFTDVEKATYPVYYFWDMIPK